MKFRYRWLPDEKVCFVRYEGDWDTDGFIEADTEIYAATHGDGVRFVFDARRVQLEADTDEVRKYVEWLGSLNLAETHPKQRAALVVTGAFETAIAILIENWTDEDTPFEICSTMETACEKLGIASEILESVGDLSSR